MCWSQNKIYFREKWAKSNKCTHFETYARPGWSKILKQEITKGIVGKIGSLLLKSRLGKFKARLSAEDIGGAMIYGLRGVVVKAQGSSKAKGFSSAQ